jgi:hypothetical protein
VNHWRRSLWRQATDTAADLQLTYEEIAARAYAKHLHHQTLHDCAVQDWFEAERELILEKLALNRFYDGRLEGPQRAS